MAPVKPSVRRLLAQVNKAATPPIEAHQVKDQGDRILYGLLEDARNLLKGLLLLAASDHDEAGDSLAREIIEHAATAGWLATAPAEHGQAVVTGYAVEWKREREVWHRAHQGETFTYS